MRIVLALLLCGVPRVQDDEAAGWVRRLAHDDFAEREKADEHLRKLGESARPSLEQAVTTEDPEVRTRCQIILAAMDALLPTARPLQPGWTVALPVREYALEELPDLLKKQIPVVLEVPPELAKEQIRIGAQNTGFFQFLDRLTEAHGAIVYAPGSAPGSFRLAKGTPPRAPACYLGPLRVALDRLTLESWERFDTTWRGASMVLSLMWQPDVAPLPAELLPYKLKHEVSDVEIFDAEGNPIRGIGAHHDAGFEYSRARMEPGGWRVRVRIPDPAPKVRRLSLIRGKIRMIFPTKIEHLEFKKPLAEGLDAGSLGVFTVRYHECRRNESVVATAFSFSRAVADRKGEADERLNLASRYAEAMMRMVGVDGKEYPLHFMLGSQERGSQQEVRRFSGYFDVPGDVAALKIPLVMNYSTNTFEFEFRNVDLP